MAEALTAEEAAELAERYRRSLNTAPGTDVVVLITDYEGEFVGVSSTEDDARTRDILEAALRGAEHRAHPNANIIDVEGHTPMSSPSSHDLPLPPIIINNSPAWPALANRGQVILGAQMPHHLVEILLRLGPDRRSEIIKQALDLGDLGGFETDPRDSASLEELRSAIDDALGWENEADEEAGDYVRRVREVGVALDTARELARKLELDVNNLGERIADAGDITADLQRQLHAANKKWQDYEHEHILPCFKWASECGLDLEALVLASPGKNCTALLVEALRERIDTATRERDEARRERDVAFTERT